ncbi:MAG: glycosyltransferase, partial [Bacteroidota bacterium]
IEAAVAQKPFSSKVVFHYYDLPDFIANQERTLWGDMLNVYLWEVMVFFFLKKRFRKQQFDVAQKVTIVSHRFPSFAWYFAMEYIHGPIAGGERFPLSMLPLFSFKNRIKELARFFFAQTPRLDPLVRRSQKKATQIIAVTPESKSILPKSVQDRCIVQQAISIEADNEFADRSVASTRNSEGPLKLLFVGRLLQWKGLGIALQAVEQLHQEIDIEFNIAGSGADGAGFKAYAEAHKLPVNFLGQVARTQLAELYSSHDLFVFPSLRDSGGFVILEAKAYQLPCLVLKLGGPAMHCEVEKDIIVEVESKNLTQIIAEVARSIRAFYHTNKISGQIHEKKIA